MTFQTSIVDDPSQHGYLQEIIKLFIYIYIYIERNWYSLMEYRDRWSLPDHDAYQWTKGRYLSVGKVCKDYS